MENIVWKIRTWIYITAVVVFSLITLCHSVNAFWPPDMVPHPVPPEKAKDDSPEIDPNDYVK